MRSCRTDEAVRTHFAVFDADGVTKLTGQAAACVPTLWHDGAPSAVAVTVTEIGVSGEYYAEFTPNAVGAWHVEVLDPADVIWQEDFEAREADIDLIWEYESGFWQIDVAASQMVFYERDGVTELARYDLIDGTGAPATWAVLTGPFGRELV